MKSYPDLSKILKPYENKWVLLSFDMKRVLAAGKTLAEAKGKYKKTLDEVVIYRVPRFDSYFVPVLR